MRIFPAAPIQGRSARQRLWRRRWLRAAAVAAVAVALAAALRATPPFRAAEARLFDVRAQLFAGRQPADTSIVFVVVDENSLEALRHQVGQWPWPRELYAGMLRYLHAAGARLVGFDITFPEADLARALSDTLFAEALAETRLAVLGLTFSPGDPAEADVWSRNRAAADPSWPERHALLRAHALAPAAGASPLDHAYAEPPPPLFARYARALGDVGARPDPDGVIRRTALTVGHGGRLYPSLSLAAARLLDPARFGGPVSAAPDELRVAEERIPLRDGQLLLRWRGPYMQASKHTYAVYPAFHLINAFQQLAAGEAPGLPLEPFRNKVVLLGVTAAAVPDIAATPLTAADPGLIVHATALDNLLHGDYLRAAPAWLNALVLGLSGLLVAFCATLLSAPLLAAGATVLLLATLLVTGAAAYVAGVWLELAGPLLAGSLSFAGAMASNYAVEGRARRRVRDLFSRYVSPEYVRRLAEEHEELKLGGERVTLTVLFIDIRGFTSISEVLPAEQVIGALNEYLATMSDIVVQHGGTVDKFIGDAVMAFWGAPIAVPDHAARACAAALAMAQAVAQLNERWRGLGVTQPLAVGIGIHTGEAVVGNIGSLARKLDYTAIGDTVNLASRLEGMNKQYGTTILVTESAAAAAGESFALRPLGSVPVRGREEVVNILELTGRPAGAAARVLVALLGLVCLSLFATPAQAQKGAPQLQWLDWIYQPGAWRSGQLVPRSARQAEPDSLALVGRAHIYTMAPRWRAEVQRVSASGALEAALVLVHDGKETRVLTPVGATALAQHAAARDALVRYVLELVTAEPARQRVAAERLTKRSAAGTVEWVAQRRPVARMAFAEHLLSAGSAGRLTRNLLNVGVQAAGGERRQDVVATVAARGATRIKVPGGTIEVQPDTAGVLRLESFEVPLLELDRFRRALERAADSARGRQPRPQPARAERRP